MHAHGYAATSPDAPLTPYTFERRDLRPNDVAIAIEFCGICHSDLHIAHNEWGFSTYPIVLGHEIVGRVIDVGSEVSGFAPGDRVERIDIDLLPAEVVDSEGNSGLGAASMAIMGSPLREARESFEREYLRIQIRRFSGNISRTATFIGMERSALHRKLKALGLADRRDIEE